MILVHGKTPTDDMLKFIMKNMENAKDDAERLETEEKLLKHKLKRKELRSNLFNWIMSSVSISSQNMIQKHHANKLYSVKLEKNVIGLFQLLKETHTNSKAIKATNLITSRPALSDSRNREIYDLGEKW